MDVDVLRTAILVYACVGPFVILPLYVYFTLKFEDIRIREFLIMIFISCIPFFNLMMLIVLLCYSYNWGGIFNKTLFRKKGN